MIDQPSIKQEGKFMLYMSISVLLEFLNSLDNVCDRNHIHLLFVKFIFMIDSWEKIYLLTRSFNRGNQQSCWRKTYQERKYPALHTVSGSRMSM